MAQKCFYEVVLNDSKASKLRLVESLLQTGSGIQMMSTIGGLVALAKVEPAKIERFVEICKPYQCLYKSPWYFDNGSIRDIYESAEAELEGRQSEGYLAWLKRNPQEDLE